MTSAAPSSGSLAADAAYLAKLNADQRRAVEHGFDSGGGAVNDAAPLLIIAGAGSGKTNTLAHRVAHLIVGGVDPRETLRGWGLSAAELAALPI